MIRKNTKNFLSFVKILIKVNLIVFIFTFLSFTNSFADQCVVISKEQAMKAVKEYLKEGIQIYYFCVPCKDRAPKTEIIRDVQMSQDNSQWASPSEFNIFVNHEKIDLAYTYVPDSKGNYVNLAFIIGCPTEDVSKNLPLVTSIPSANDKQKDSEIKVKTSNIDISVEVEPELFPVIAKFLADGNEQFNIPGLVKWRIRNESNESIKITVVSEIPEWTPLVIKTIGLDPHESRELIQTPFGVNLLRNHESVPATLILKAKTEDKVLFEETKNIRIRASGDMIWSLHSPWDTEYLIAAWVTPKNPVVEKILSIAKERLYGRSLSGYLGSNVQEQVRAIFNAVRDIGVSYVNSTVSFGQVGFTQRIRLPNESISQKAANCIDGAVLLASLFENIGLEPLIIIVPGHAFIGVKLSLGSKETLFIETTLLGREIVESILTGETTFDAAVRAANEKYIRASYESQYKPDALHIVDIKKAREIGIYPLW